MGETSQLGEEGRAYLSYTDQSKRITTYYAYGHDQATGEKQLKNWQVYDHPAIVKRESVAYSFTNAKLKKNDNGTISVYYYGDQELQNDKASAEVDPSLMARAQRTLAKDMGDSIDSGETAVNFVIPKPYYINSNGDTVNLDWRLSMDGKDISIDFTPEASEYPLALDPTLSFTAPAMSNTGDAIRGEAGSNFGYAMTTGDFNADGKTDLAVGASSYSSGTGRAYIFYNDGGMTTQAVNADIAITGEAGSSFGYALTPGDFNADGRIDLVVGASNYSAGNVTGRAYIFYNDGTIPTTATTADVIITGEATNNNFGASFVSGDFNFDGKTDLIVGAFGYSTNTGRAYIFYNDGSIPTTAATADVIITGAAIANSFGISLTSGDLNADGRVDIVVGATDYSSNTGRAYIFYNDGSIPTTAATADVTITGNASSDYFGSDLANGDFNADGRIDLVVGVRGYSSSTGRAYIFYNDGSIPTTAGTADVTITGETSNNVFGRSIVSGDFNADGKTDLAIGAYYYSSVTGRAYIFYNDGSIPTTAATADVIITGETTNNSFGWSLASGDFNADGKTDLVVGAFQYSSGA
ncbi:MAG: FG-GAP-like repeat-containing protein, partial [Candidatus Moraniibacteriota bacterium]